MCRNQNVVFCAKNRYAVCLNKWHKVFSMKNKNTSSRFITIAVSIAAITIVIVAGLMINQSTNTLDNLAIENEKLEKEMQERDSMVNEFVAAFDTIESNLTFINERRSQLVLNDDELTVSQKDAIISDIKLMNSMLAESNAKIAELERKLNKSGAQIRSFKNKIASLTRKLERQNNLIAELKSMVEQQNEYIAEVTFVNDSLNNQMLAIIDTLELKDSIIVDREEKITEQFGLMNKAFYAYGTTKELSENGVIKKEGGVLGLGSTKKMLNNFNEEYFTKIDIIEQRTIELNAKKVTLISKHPEDSYKLIEEDGLITKLEIETPEDFWKISHYAVIEVKL